MRMESWIAPPPSWRPGTAPPLEGEGGCSRHRAAALVHRQIAPELPVGHQPRQVRRGPGRGDGPGKEGAGAAPWSRVGANPTNG